MIPSGYKDQKIYSVKPTDGTGDLTFSRASSATRVGPDGLIEKVRTNLITYSQALTNASWSQVNIATATAGQTDPNGGTGATTFGGSNGSNAIVTKDFATTSGTPYTISIYIKGASAGTINFNHSGTTLAPQNTISYTTSWQRFTYSFVADSSTSTLFLGAFFSWDNGEQITFAFGQAETGDIATDYIPTTTAAVSVGPVSGLPRLDYLNSTCPKLLLEPQRSSMITFSEQLDNAAWTKNVATITANASVSPDGYTNADTLTESTFTSDSAFIYETLVVTPSTPYTTSVFVKQGAGRYVYLRNYYNAGNAYHTVVVDTQTGTITQASVGSGVINASSSIESYGNGWYRVSATQTSTVEIALFPIIGLSATATPTVGSFGQITIASNAGRSASVWGCQVEAGAYATSYIPTLGASVTRVADACSKTSATALIGQTEGTLFSEIEVISGTTTIGIWLRQSGSLYDNMIQIEYNNSSTAIRGSVVNGGVTQAEMTGPVIGAGVHKIALAYKANNFALYVNGVQVGTDSSGTVPTCNEIYIDQYIDGGSRNATKKSALLFKTRLTNAQLAELTA